jgi:Osmosensitive K+ channel histidine kinase
MGNLKLRLLSNFVIVFLLLAFAWWSILLYTKNKDAFEAKSNYLQIVLAAEGKIDNRAAFEKTVTFQELEEKYKRQEWMIFGEALFFILSLVIGIYIINRGYNREMIAAQERRNFLLSITHELKSPISSIRLVLETFLKRDLDNQQINQLSGTALEETVRLTTLVEDLLLAAKMENHYQPVLESVDIVKLIDQLVERLRGKFPEVTFSYSYDKSISNIMADRTGLTSITLNLLENAVKYSPTPADIKVKLNQKGNYLFLDFADQGYGITEKEKKKIFRKFYRTGSEDTRSTKGTGLGLYIVKEIVEAHKGTITIKDNEPKGSIFKIKLPQKNE